jgi:hypothetical protein
MNTELLQAAKPEVQQIRKHPAESKAEIVRLAEQMSPISLIRIPTHQVRLALALSVTRTKKQVKSSETSYMGLHESASSSAQSERKSRR